MNNDNRDDKSIGVSSLQTIRSADILGENDVFYISYFRGCAVAAVGRIEIYNKRDTSVSSIFCYGAPY